MQHFVDFFDRADVHRSGIHSPQQAETGHADTVPVRGGRRKARILGGMLLVVATSATIAAAETPTVDAAALPEFIGNITADDVRPHIEYLASPELKGRSGASAEVAAEYIKTHFQKCGLQPLFEGGDFFQAIPGTAPEGELPDILGRNVGAFLPGSDPELRDEMVIISAHYDHLGVRGGQIYAGADDNASGVSMLLEVAEQLASGDDKPRRSVAFVAFDLEEHMLWGSRWFAAHPPRPLEQVALFITADMIGRSLGGLPLNTVFVLGSESAPLLKDMLDAVGEPKGLDVARMGVDLLGPLPRSDYGPFRARQVPFLFFSTGEHPDYHTPRDVPERIDYDKVSRVSSLVLRLTVRAANSDEAPEWTEQVEPDIDEARALHRIATMLLEADGDRALNSVQRFIVSHAQTKTKQIIERGEMTPAERTWLIRVSQAMLLSVF